ncbi:MAG: ABC transporter ATP-binding protein [Verrucomicrobiota bacterium]
MNSSSSTTSQTVVEAAGLTKVFRDFWGRPKARALGGIDFSVQRGQVFGLLGPNGSGKSTTVKLILGLLHPTRGELRVLGRRPREVDVKKHIGYLPEETYLYSYLTAAESLDFFGALFGLPADERNRRTEQLLEMVGMTHAARRPVGEFSKGMARRIGLAQALINDPELVILDEPTSGLDPIGCREVKDVIRVLAERGKTVILSSHLLADVEDVCDDIAVLYGGRIRTRGALRELLAVKDRTQINTPALDSETLEKIRAVLSESVDANELEITRPHRNLEQFFLEVVRSARSEDVATAGVATEGQVADYLRQPAAEKGETILKNLAEETPLPTEEQAPEPPTDNQQREKAEQRIKTIVNQPEPAQQESADQTKLREQDEQDQNRKQASERLKKLVGEDQNENNQQEQ